MYRDKGDTASVVVCEQLSRMTKRGGELAESLVIPEPCRGCPVLGVALLMVTMMKISFIARLN